MFEGLGLLTSAEFDGAYQAAKDFTAALRKRVRSAGFMETMVLQRICSSYASGLSTAKRLLEKRQIPDDGDDDYRTEDFADILDEECVHLQRINALLGRRPTDPKLDAVLFFLRRTRLARVSDASFSASITTPPTGWRRVSPRV